MAANNPDFPRLMGFLHDSYRRNVGGELTPEVVKKYCNVSAETARSWLKGRRHPTLEGVRDLAALAGLSPVEAFLELGWLAPSDLAAQTGQADGRPSTAPQDAVAAVLADPGLRRRFEVTLTTLESEGAFPLTTDVVAGFRLRTGHRPLPAPQAELQARLARLDRSGEPERYAAADPDYHAVRLELAAFMKDRLRWSGQYTWQGEPGAPTWAGFGAAGPVHVLVQDVVSGVSRPADAEPWTARPVRPLVFIGGRYSCGLAAAFTAQGLGWQYALVCADATIGRNGTVNATRRDPAGGPAEAWGEAAAYIADRASSALPWHTVLSVRPHAFLRPDGTPDYNSLEQLRRSPARVVFVRPDEAALDWWIERQIGLAPDRSYAGAAAAHRAELAIAFDQIENTLVDRGLAVGVGDLDLRFQQPAPETPWEPHRPELPPALVDGQLRLAWEVVVWLGQTSRQAKVPPNRALRPGALAQYAAELSADAADPRTEGWVALARKGPGRRAMDQDITE